MLMKKLLLTVIVLFFTYATNAQMKQNPIPIHTFFEYGFAKNNNPSPVKLDNHTYFCGRIKISRVERRPVHSS